MTIQKVGLRVGGVKRCRSDMEEKNHMDTTTPLLVVLHFVRYMGQTNV